MNKTVRGIVHVTSEPDIMHVMNIEYYIVHNGTDKVDGPYAYQFEAEKLLNKYPGAKMVPVYCFDKEEEKLRKRGPFTHFICVVISLLMLCGMIGGAGYFICSSYQKANAVKNWKATPALLTISNITETKHEGAISELSLRGSFVYEVGGEEHMSADMGVYENQDVRALMSFGDEYQVVQNVTCYVNPDNPEEAVLFNNPDGSLVPHCVAGVVILLGVCGLFSLHRKCKQRAYLRSLNLVDIK